MPLILLLSQRLLFDWVITRIVRMMKLYFMIDKRYEMKHICLLISMQATVIISMTIFMGMVYKLFKNLY